MNHIRRVTRAPNVGTATVRGQDGPVTEPVAHVGGQWAWGLTDVSSDLGVLDRTGRWAVVLPYAGPPICLRFDSWSGQRPPDLDLGRWAGPGVDTWVSSMSRGGYIDAVGQTRELIAKGAVYQANICRIMSARVDEQSRIGGLYELLRRGNPAPHGSLLEVPSEGLLIASASPELFLARHGDRLISSPIKGTGRTAGDLRAKDEAENIMIVDLVRNDLSKVCLPGTVEVPALLRLEQHPGLVHLVSDVTGVLRPSSGWADIVDALFPPGSVTGAPKSSALRIIDELETTSRGVYCGAIGWVDADSGDASFAVAIRTFWKTDDVLHFGTGAGITWGSDPEAEWGETELKARHLVELASGVWQGEGDDLGR